MATTVQDRDTSILVVDDEESVRTLLSRFLVRKGFAVEEADGFDQVRERAAARRFDLITLDISMPGTNGIGVLKWLREHHPDTGVIMATAIDNFEVVIEAMRLGAYSYILKPFALDLVVEDLARALERQQLVAENRAYQMHLEEMVDTRTRQLGEACAELEKNHVRITRQLRELQGRDRLMQLQMAPPEEVDAAYAEAIEVVKDVLEVECAALYRPDEMGQQLCVVAALGENDSLQPVPITENGNPLGKAFLAGQPYEGEAGEVIAPILHRDETLGVLLVTSVTGDREERTVALNALWRLTREIALVLRVVQMTEDLEKGDIEVSALLEMEE